jgi:hypothetical protein
MNMELCCRERRELVESGRGTWRDRDGDGDRTV